MPMHASLLQLKLTRSYSDGGRAQQNKCEPVYPPVSALPGLALYCPTLVVAQFAPYAPLLHSTLSKQLLDSYQKAMRLAEQLQLVSAPHAAIVGVSDATAAAAPVVPVPQLVYTLHVTSAASHRLAVDLDLPFGQYCPSAPVAAFALKCSYTQPAASDSKQQHHHHHQSLEYLTPKAAAVSGMYQTTQYDASTMNPIDPTNCDDRTDEYRRRVLQLAMDLMEKQLAQLESKAQTCESTTMFATTSASSSSIPSSSCDSSSPTTGIAVADLQLMLEQLQTQLHVFRSTFAHETAFHRATRDLEKISIDDVIPPAHVLLDHLHALPADCAIDRLDVMSLRPVTNDKCLERFMQARAEYAARGLAHIEVAFHGTRPESVASIVTNGLRVPGEVLETTGEELRHRVDEGYFGKGIYLSPCFSYSNDYAGDNGSVFVCLVLSGRVFDCSHWEGRGLEPGFDSHRGVNGLEWVQFDSRTVLPIAILELVEGTC